MAFNWDDNVVKVMLECTLEFKSDNEKLGKDWETIRSKYEEICSRMKAAGVRDDVTKERVAAKIKKVRASYKEAVDKGRRSGGGRLVLVWYDLCASIWGGSPAVNKLPNGECTLPLLFMVNADHCTHYM